MLDDDYVQNLFAEKDILDPQEFSHTVRILENEINRIRTNEEGSNDLTNTKFKEEMIKLTEKVMVPVEEYPKFNFVGKLLGPKGNTLKRLQGNTKTRISILGRGSTRNKEKEEELSLGDDPKYEHLKEPLHVLIEVEALKSEAHQRLGTALAEIYKYLIPENDELRQQQMREMAMLTGNSSQKSIGRVGNPMFSFAIQPPGAFALNELHGPVVHAKDVQSYGKISPMHNPSYEIYPEASVYPMKPTLSRKRSNPSNGYPVKNPQDSYGDY